MTSQDVTLSALPHPQSAIAIGLPFSPCVGPSIVYSTSAADLALLLSADPGVVEFRCIQLASEASGPTIIDFEVTTRDEIVFVTANLEGKFGPGVVSITPRYWPLVRLSNLKTLAEMANSNHAAVASMHLVSLLADCEYVTVGEAAAVIGVPDPFGVIAYLFFKNVISLRIDDEPLSPSTKLSGPAVDSIVERIIEEASR